MAISDKWKTNTHKWEDTLPLLEDFHLTVVHFHSGPEISDRVTTSFSDRVSKPKTIVKAYFVITQFIDAD